MIAIFAITSILLTATMMVQEVYAPPPQTPEKINIGPVTSGQVIPDWVRTTMGYYLEDQISEREILDAFNWLFENNIMHLSQEAAQEVQDLRDKVEEQASAISTLRTLVTTQAMTVGERIMQSEYGSGDSTATLDDEIMVLLRPAPGADMQSEDEIMVLLRPVPGADMQSEDEIMVLLRPASGADGEIIITEDFRASVADFNFASQTVDDILRKGGTVSAWEEGIAAFQTNNVDKSVIPELAGIVVLCNNEIDKKTQQIDAELRMIELWLGIISEEQERYSNDAYDTRTSDSTSESQTQYRESDLDFITRNLISIDQQIKALDTGIMVLEEKLQSTGEDGQLANIDLQNQLQKQQQTLQTMSNVSKVAHDTAMAIIRK